MSLKASSVALVAVAALSGGVLWWGISSSQTQAPQAQTQAAQDQRALLENERNTVDLVRRYGDGVVYVAVRSVPQVQAQRSPFPGFDFFFGQPQPREGLGSGFVIDKEGYILTNFHVVQGSTQITVRFHNDPKQYKATVVGTAEPLDLALIRVQGVPQGRLVPLVLGNSDGVLVGQKAIAMGNPFGLEFTVTEGVVSAVRQNRGAVAGAVGDSSGLVPTIIQTDAAINPGNSGGPLLNSRGEVIGINTAILSPSGAVTGEGQFAGVGFALPINLAKQYLPDLKAGKKLDAAEIARRQPRLGIEVATLSNYPDAIIQRNRLPEQGLMVIRVEPNTPAAKAGLRGATRSVTLQLQTGETVDLGINGDVIIEADGQPIQDIFDLRAVLNSKAGQPVNLKVWRDGKELTLQVTPQVQGR
ncbi:MAG: serine protease [Meiothermus sp.]